MKLWLLVLLWLAGLASCEYCVDDSDCSGYLQTCCSDSVCRRYCYSCTTSLDCGTGEKCCSNGDCIYSFDSCPVEPGVIVGSVLGVVIFLVIVISVLACCCCACCPYYRGSRASAGAVIIAQPNPYQQIVSTSTTLNHTIVPPHPNYQATATYPPPPYAPPAYAPPTSNYPTA